MEEVEKTKYVKKLIELVAKKESIDIKKYNMDEMIMGMSVELEHGSHNEKTNITSDDPLSTLKIVLAHLDEIPDYYTRLAKMEKGAEKKKENIKENFESKRNKELCGLVENETKKPLSNKNFQEKAILKEEINKDTFQIIKFENDGLGKKASDQERDLYKMDSL